MRALFRSIPIRSKAALVAVCAVACTPPGAPHAPRRSPPTLPHVAITSFATPWASPARSSRVDVARRTFTALDRVADLDAPPLAVVVNAAGDHVALDSGSSFELRDASGAPRAKRDKAAGGPFVLGPRSLLATDRDVPFAPEVPSRSLGVESNNLKNTWFARLGATDGVFLFERHGAPFMRHVGLPDGAVAEVADQSPPAMAISVGRFWGEGPSTFTRDKGADFEATGCGALRDDAHVALALADKRFFVFDTTSAAKEGVLSASTTATLTFVPSDISALEKGFALLAPAVDGTTSVHVVDDTGRETWSVRVPFVVESPPIDGGGGRIYLAGAGFAAAESGKILWAQPSSAHVHATALGDGSVLVAIGPELRVTGRGGAILQTLRVPDGAPLVTPPAIAADGRAWVATAKQLYVAR